MSISINLTACVTRAIVIATWCVILCTSMAAQRRPRHQSRVVIEIVSIPYQSTAISAVSPKQLVTQWDEFRLLIKEGWIASSIMAMMDSVHLDTTTKYGGWLDAHIVCLIHRDNKRVDTVSFGDYLMQINGKVGYLQPIPLLTLAQYLPKMHYDDIWQYINDGWLKMSADIPKYGYQKEVGK